MSRRDGYQPGVPSWIAGAHPDPEQAVSFYDVTAKTATELGGAVLDGPVDLPIGRQATLADPQGATFSVTRIAAP
jgi:hypothetical protein